MKTRTPKKAIGPNNEPKLSKVMELEEIEREGGRERERGSERERERARGVREGEKFREHATENITEKTKPQTCHWVQVSTQHATGYKDIPLMPLGTDRVHPTCH